MSYLKKYFLLIFFLFLIPSLGLSTSLLLEKRHDNSFYRSVEKQLNKTRAQLQSLNITPDEVCVTQINDIKVRHFCRHYGRFQMLMNFSLWALCLGIGLILLVPLAGFLSRQNRTVFLITIYFALIVCAVSIALQTVALNYIIALLMIIIFNHGFGYGIAEGLGILGLLLSFAMIGLAISAARFKEMKSQENIFQRVRKTINALRLSFKDADEEHFIRHMVLFPGRLMLEYCLDCFKEGKTPNHHRRAKG